MKMTEIYGLPSQAIIKSMKLFESNNNETHIRTFMFTRNLFSGSQMPVKTISETARERCYELILYYDLLRTDTLQMMFIQKCSGKMTR